MLKKIKYVQLTQTNLFSVALSRESVSFETWLDVDVGNDGSAGSTLKRDLGRLGLDAGSRNDDARNLDQARYLKKNK